MFYIRNYYFLIFEASASLLHQPSDCVLERMATAGEDAFFHPFVYPMKDVSIHRDAGAASSQIFEPSKSNEISKELVFISF